MLVVDRIEESLLKNINQVRDLKCKDTVRSQQASDALDDAAQIINVGEDIVAGDHFGGSVLCANVSRHFWREKGRPGLNSFASCFLGYASRRIDPQHTHSGLLEKGEQSPVIRSNVHNQASLWELELLG